jgi:hypothetical protein
MSDLQNITTAFSLLSDAFDDLLEVQRGLEPKQETQQTWEGIDSALQKIVYAMGSLNNERAGV